MNNINEHIDETFKQLESDFEVANKTFENCIFKQCDFTSKEFRNASFVDCMFDECNVSLVDVMNTKLSDVTFRLSKVSGIDFTRANKFLLRINFESCIISSSCFSELKLNKTQFVDCKISNSDFISASLGSADFSKSEFNDVIFDNTDLSKANFTDAKGYNINPNINKIKKAIFTMPDVISLLGSLDIVIK